MNSPACPQVNWKGRVYTAGRLARRGELEEGQLTAAGYSRLEHPYRLTASINVCNVTMLSTLFRS